MRMCLYSITASLALDDGGRPKSERRTDVHSENAKIDASIWGAMRAYQIGRKLDIDHASGVKWRLEE